jgi:hypothetical protein
MPLSRHGALCWAPANRIAAFNDALKASMDSCFRRNHHIISRRVPLTRHREAAQPPWRSTLPPAMWIASPFRARNDDENNYPPPHDWGRGFFREVLC